MEKKQKAIIVANIISGKQKEKFEEYCNRKHFEIIKFFDLFDSNSSVAKEILEFLAAHQDKIAVVAENIHELQKGLSFTALPMMNDLIQQKKIELHFYKVPSIIGKKSTQNEILMWSICVFLNKAYIKSIEG